MDNKEIKKETRGLSTGAALFLTGAAIGAAAGVLLAPEKGQDTRRKVGQWLKEKSKKGKEELISKKQLVAEVMEAGKKAYKEAEKKHLVGV